MNERDHNTDKAPGSTSTGAIRAASVEECAALDFEAWNPDENPAPTDQEWEDMSRDLLINLRSSQLAMCKTKAELVKIISDDSTPAEPFYDSLNSMAETLRTWADMFEGAAARVLCGLAVVALIEEREAGPK